MPTTSLALPPGASLLSISGRQCTAIPRTDAAFLSSILQTNLLGVSASTTAPPAATTAPPAVTTPPSAPNVAPTSASTLDPAANAIPIPVPALASLVSSITSHFHESSSSSTLPEAPVSTSVVPSSLPSSPASSLQTTSSSLSPSPSSSSLQSSLPAPSPSPAPSPAISSTTVVIGDATPIDTVAAKTTSSTSSTLAIAQSEVSPEFTSTNTGKLSGTKATTTSSLTTPLSSASAAAQSSPVVAAAATPSGSKAGPIVGGIFGAFAFIGLVIFGLLYLRRRKRRRDSFLTPLSSDPGDFSRSGTPASDRAVTPLEKLKTQIGSGLVVVGTTLSTLKSRVNGRRKNSINMDRGNSQFLERIPQHSRQNSALSGQQNLLSKKERFMEWFERTKQDVLFNIRVKLDAGKAKEPIDPFAATNEKQATSTVVPVNPDFSQLLTMDDTELQKAAERRRESLAANGAALGSLRLNFDKPSPGNSNPFSDPINPFDDPSNVVSAPKPSQQPTSIYSGDVRRSRGQSMAQTIDSRYPSYAVPDRDSYDYRDTYMSSATDGRKTKGRSDPFDLEKLHLESTSSKNIAGEKSPLFMNGYNNAGSGSELIPRVVSKRASQVSSTGTYSSKYSSGVLSEWGEPGPDLGPGSSSTFGVEDAGHKREDSNTIEVPGINASMRSVGKAI